MLKRANEYLPPHKTPLARYLPDHLFSRPGRALLASQRARKSVLDVQHRQPDIGIRTVSREADRDQARGDLDDSRIVCLDSLRRTGLGCVFVFDTRARRRACRRVNRVESGRYGSKVLAVGVWMVFGRATVIAVFYVSGAECESRARGAAGLGSNVSVVLVVLAGAYGGDNSHPMAIWPPPLEHLAM